MLDVAELYYRIAYSKFDPEEPISWWHELDLGDIYRSQGRSPEATKCLTNSFKQQQELNGTDWLPTLCAASEADLPQKKVLDGANILPALLHEAPVIRPRPMMWWLWHARGGDEVAMRDGDYKLLATMIPQADPGNDNDAQVPKNWSIMQFIKQAELARFEMFDRQNDPSETTDLATSQPERFEKLKKTMIDLHAEIRLEGPTYDLKKR